MTRKLGAGSIGVRGGVVVVQLKGRCLKKGVPGKTRDSKGCSDRLSEYRNLLTIQLNLKYKGTGWRKEEDEQH